MTMSTTRETVLAEFAKAPKLEPPVRAEWWRGAAIYEAYVRSFRDTNGDGVGDLRGVLEKLDHIAGLGVDALWLSPFYPSPQKDFGYDAVDYRNVDPSAGTLDDFLALLKAAHARGLKLLMDFIPAHTSDEHPWFQESRSSRENARAEWYVWADAAPDGGPPNNWLSSFGGGAWQWEPRRSQYYYHPFLACQPALNLRKPEALEAVIQDMRFWLDLGVDGFRLDAVQCLACDPDLRSNPPSPRSGSPILLGGGPNNPFGRQIHLFDRDVPEALPIIHALRAAVESYDPPRVLIGELADVDSSRAAEKYTADGQGFHTVYDFDLINTPADVASLASLLRLRDEYLRSGWLYNVFTNHDSLRAVSNLAAFASDKGETAAAARMLLFLQFTLKGGGALFQGEELGLPHPKLPREQLQDPWGLALWPDFQGRDGGRTPMPWEAEASHAGFTSGDSPWLPVPEIHRPLAVDRQEQDPDSTLNFLRRFLAWRRGQPILKWGGEHVHEAHTAPLLVYDRFDQNTVLRCMINFSMDERLLPLEEGWRCLRAPGCVTRLARHGLPLPPLGFAILRA
ncbi:alpha-amylase family glycosyl hydrolase [Teichococcus aestuarii]|uniref:Alpha-glucosidase n=1 Tax=Teichococcus aestuarii TaxID=568898 RepID=A0A2U1V103_9PROT|nr:alpha-amylase family glycosyl hydrolase [Pseudoroseomonas aestuarii]PWC27587.1 alpha-glucosidase [Pseudoroseomonas aestuarii]